MDKHSIIADFDNEKLILNIALQLKINKFVMQNLIFTELNRVIKEMVNWKNQTK